MNIYRLSSKEFRTWRAPVARHALKNRIFEAHGVTQIRAPSGRILGTTRGDVKRVPLEQSKARGAHHATAPGECLCREWQKPPGHEDNHHPLCARKEAWEAQLARSPDTPRPRAVLKESASGSTPKQQPAEAEPSATESKEALERAPTVPEPQPPALPAPEECVCREWAGAPPGEHHMLCEFRARWLEANQKRPPELVELETGVVAREATEEEVIASRVKADEDGVGVIELSDGKLYYVRQP